MNPNVYYSKKSIKSFLILLLPFIFFIGFYCVLLYLKIKGHDTRVGSNGAIIIGIIALLSAIIVFFGLNYRIINQRVEIRILADIIFKIQINEIIKIQLIRKSFNVIGFSSECIQIITKNKTYNISPKSSLEFFEKIQESLKDLKKSNL